MAAFCVVFVMAMMSLASVHAEAQIPGRPQEYVQDEAGVLSDREMASINKTLADYDEETHNRIDVLLVRTTDGESVRDYADRVISMWRTGVSGQEQEPDAVIVAATDDGKITAKTGAAMAKTVSESDISGIIKGKHVKGGISDGDWTAAIQGTVTGFRNAGAKSNKRKKATEKNTEEDSFSALKDAIMKTIALLLGISVIIFVINYAVVMIHGGDTSEVFVNTCKGVLEDIPLFAIMAVLAVIATFLIWQGGLG